MATAPATSDTSGAIRRAAWCPAVARRIIVIP